MALRLLELSENITSPMEFAELADSPIYPPSSMLLFSIPEDEDGPMDQFSFPASSLAQAFMTRRQELNRLHRYVRMN
jgi:hypothetical protein